MKRINEQKLQEKIQWKPHKAQQEVLKNLKRFNVIVAGVRWGKSQLSAYVALKELLKNKKTIWIVSGTYDLSRRVFEHLVTFIGNAGWRTILSGVSYKPIPRIDVPAWKTKVVCKSAENPAGLLGEAVDLAIIDEAQLLPRDIWENYLRARLVSTQGKAIFIGTPLGKNYFYELYLMGKDEKYDEWASFNYPTKTNPYVKKKELEEIQKTVPKEIYLQNYEALFLDQAASYFKNVRDIVSDDTLSEPIAGHQYILAVDLAKYRDWNVITILDRYEHKVVFIDRFQKENYTIVKEKILSLARKYNNASIILDSTGLGRPISDDLKREYLFVNDFQFTGKTKEELLSKLKIYIDQKAIVIPPYEPLIEELEAFTIKRLPSGRIIYSAPEGYHDDCVISLALAVWQLTTPEIKPTPKVNQIYSFKRKFEYD